MALSITFCSAGLAFSNSAHRARGTTQNASYVYRRGFSFTSADCAHAGAAQPPAITIAHNPDRNCQFFFFIENPLWLVFEPMKYTSNRSRRRGAGRGTGFHPVTDIGPEAAGG